MARLSHKSIEQIETDAKNAKDRHMSSRIRNEVINTDTVTFSLNLYTRRRDVINVMHSTDSSEDENDHG